jgi:HK97 family phage major capsid protein
MFITEQQSQYARKHAMLFHKKNNIRSLGEIQPHALAWENLRDIIGNTATEARSLLEKAQSAEDETKAESFEQAHDAFMALYDKATEEAGYRNQIGSREPRASGSSPEQLAKRPGVEPGEARNGDYSSEPDTVYALEPEQRFTTWAQARSNGVGDYSSEEYRGLTAGKYFRSMILGAKTDAERRALAEGTDSAGGYTVPDVLSAELIDLARATSVVSQAGARTVPLTSDNNVVAKLLTDPVPAWRLEAGAVAESDPTFGLLTLTPRSLAVQTKISLELMEDSLNLATELPRIMAAKMAEQLDAIALLGTGTAPEPEGIANVTGIGTFAQDAAIASYANLSKARTGILTANSGPVTAFVMHPRDEGAFTDLADTTNQPLNAPKAISDIPILTTTSIPIDGGAGSDESTIFAGNFNRLLVGIRSDIRVELVKTSTYASNLQYTLVAHMRADVAVTHPGAFYTLTGVQG